MSRMFFHRALPVMVLALFSVISCYAKEPVVKPVQTGIDVLVSDHFKELKGKKIGLVTNPTGVNSDLVSTIDLLFNAPDVE